MSYLTQQPDSVSLSNEGMFQVMTFRAGGAGRIRSSMVVFVLLAVALAVSVDADIDQFRRVLENPSSGQIAIAGIAALTLVLFFLPALRKAINRTSVSVGGGRLLVHSGPLPPFGSLDLSSNQMRNLKVNSKGSWFGGANSARFDILSQTSDGETQRLVADVPDQAAALFLKMQIEQRLSIPSDKSRVVGLRRPAESVTSNLQHDHALDSADRAEDYRLHSHAQDWAPEAGRNLQHEHARDASEYRSETKSDTEHTPPSDWLPTAGRNLRHDHTRDVDRETATSGSRTDGRSSAADKNRQQTSANYSGDSEIDLRSLPPSITVKRDGPATIITRHWSGKPKEVDTDTIRSQLAVVAGVVLIGAIYVGSVIAFIALLLFGTQIYKFVADQINRTEIRVGPKLITSTHLPLPWTTDSPVSAKNISSFRVTKVTHPRKKKAPRHSWTIMAKINKSEFAVLRGIPKVDEANWLERLMGDALGIEQEPAMRNAD